MRSLVILCDLDGIVADLHAPWLDWINRRVGTQLVKTDIREYQMDRLPVSKDVNVHDFLNQPGAYRNLPPVDGALETLQRLEDDGHHVLIATTPVKRPESTTEKLEWCRLYLPWLSHRRIYVGGEKDRIMADVFIDDDPKNLREFRARQPQAYLVTIAWPYNEGLDTSGVINLRAQDCMNPDLAWKTIYQHLTVLANQEPARV